MATVCKASEMLEEIEKADSRLHARFRKKLEVNHELDRTLVSFQANKSENGHRWCKYKEGFSARLIHYLFDKLQIESGRILDPFAGAGTTLFVSNERGLDATGIELLPSSAEIIEVRRDLMRCDKKKLAASIRKFRASQIWENAGTISPFHHLPITNGAFPKPTEHLLGRYLYETSRVRDGMLQRVLRFAALCILESISYTRKDGQYLRWDSRSGRRVGARPFNKGPILGFTPAVNAKLNDIADDLAETGLLFATANGNAHCEAELIRGSCLEVLPKIPTNSFDGLITSPPYCNRYDYTRTYALELAMLGVDAQHLLQMRQTMLSCTVENKEKTGLKSEFSRDVYSAACSAFESQELLSQLLEYLEHCRQEGELNNTGIPRMVRGYFQELALTIFECARVLKPGASFVMVNDNVRYQGAHVPVDLILSDFAERAGFEIASIWVLPRGKGNSSQQMGAHGRQELRKCVYVWRLKE